MFIGVVGKANVGKSTFFKAATLADVLIANYPFATIKPNSGVGFVRVECADKDFNVQCNPREGMCVNHIRFVPVQMIDVAGLVPGAHEGKGMGNQFLGDLSTADALIHVIDVSGGTNERGEPCEPLSYDPAEDIKFLEVEIDHWYLGMLKKSWDRLVKTAKQEHKEPYKEIAKQFTSMRATEDVVKEIIAKLKLNHQDATKWTEDELLSFAGELRKKTKPMIIAANKADVPGAEANVERLRTQFPSYMIVPCSSESELALKEAAKHKLIDYIPGANDFTITPEGQTKLSDRQKMGLEFIKKNVIGKFGSTGVQDVLDSAVFKLLKYIAVFPAGANKLADSNGNIMPDCFLMPPGTTALDFAFKLHTDFGKKFIKAINARTKLPIGKDHPLNHRECLEIMSG